MSKKIFVGNLPYQTSEQDVRDMISEYGTIDSLAMINDRDSGRFRGFCFVEMEDSAANAVINALNGKDIEGRALKVNEAKSRDDRDGGGNRGGGKWSNNHSRRGGRNDKFPHSGGRR